MANEWRFQKLGLEVIHDGDPDQQVRIHKLSAELVHDGDEDQEVRFYKAGFEVVRDLRNQFNPAFVDDADAIFDGFEFIDPYTWAPIGVGDDSVGFGFSFTPEPFTIDERERNPYSAHVQQDTEFFLEDQQKILRDQHNRTQAGDSTFDYGLLLKGTPNQLYTLGSLGRFYHPDFGITLARYVQFKDCVETLLQGAPVGYLESSHKVDWIVTNDFDKSDAFSIVGVMCLAETPDDDTYGWVVVEGPVPVPVGQSGGNSAVAGTPYSWSGTGTVDIGVPGLVLGRRWGESISPPVAGGTLFVRIEGLGPASLEEFVNDILVPINAQLTDHETRIEAAEASIITLQSTTASLQTQATSLQTQINLEAAARVRDINAVRSEISSADWGAEILAGDNTVRAEFQEADNSILAQLSLVKFTADNAYAAVTALDLDGLTTTVAGLTAQVEGLNLRLENFTVVNPTPTAGTVLMQMVSGIEYTFEPVDFILENLADVDTTTTPPADEDVLTWIAANSKWEPRAPTGGGGSGFQWKLPARVATTTAGTLATDFENGDTIDGVVLATGDRILIKDQAAPAENGIYVVAASGAPTRVTDADAEDELIGAAIYVLEGTANADKNFTQTETAIVVDTDPVTWVQFGLGVVVLEGTVFPSSPTDRLRFFRTDLDMEFFWDDANSQWLSATLYQLSLGNFVGSGSDDFRYNAVPFKGVFDLWMESLQTSTYRNGAGEWDTSLRWRDSANAETTLVTVDGNGRTSATWYYDDTPIGSILSSSAYCIILVADEISGSTTFFGGGVLNYRLIAT